MTFTLKADGHVLTITGAPEARNRNERGILAFLRRVKVTHDETLTWNDLRALARSVGVLVDPFDDQPAPPDWREKYRDPVLADARREAR